MTNVFYKLPYSYLNEIINLIFIYKRNISNKPLFYHLTIQKSYNNIITSHFAFIQTINIYNSLTLINIWLNKPTFYLKLFFIHIQYFTFQKKCFYTVSAIFKIRMKFPFSLQIIYKSISLLSFYLLGKPLFLNLKGSK